MSAPISQEAVSASGVQRADSTPASIKRIVQIVPRRSIQPEGIGDYARYLAGSLGANHGVETVFLSATLLPQDQTLVDQWRTETVSAREGLALVEALERSQPFDFILVHFSGYGFAKRGVPIWLVRGLEAWHKAQPTSRIATLFHELHAVTGRPWNSSFWLSPVQQSLCKRLSRLSDAVFTTTSFYAEIMSTWQPGLRPHALPVFSNIGYGDTAIPTSQRAPVLVTFGTSKVGKRIFVTGRSRLELVVQQLRVREVWDIGQRNEPLPSQVGDTKIRAFGRCSEDEIQDMLSKAAYGLVDYPAHVLDKSTVCAAYAANGVIPILLQEPHAVSDACYSVLGYEINRDALSDERRDTLQRTNLHAYKHQNACPVIAGRILAGLEAASQP